MPDDAVLQITTVVDTSQLEAGMAKAASATNQFTQSATMGFTSVKQAEAALADAQAQLGESAAQGNAQAAAIIAEYQAAVNALKASLDEETASVVENTDAHVTNNEAVSSGISDRMAASASLRTLELNMQGSTRAAGAFLTNVLGLGPVLQAAFPVIGAVALGEVLLTVGQRVYTLYQNMVNLKAEIAALGEASEKTAKQASDANWTWIQSQAELLKSQGKLKEAQEFLASHAGEKPETLSLGVDTSKLKDLEPEMKAFADQLAQVHTTAQAQSVFKELDAQMSSTQAKLSDFTSRIADLHTRIQAIEAHPTGRDDQAFAISGDIAEIDSLQHKITAYTEYYNTLQNLKNKNVSDSAAEANKVAQASEGVLRQQQTQDQASLAAHKAVADAKVAADEEGARRALQTGQITAQQEIAQLGADAQKKLQIEINYLSQLDAILSQDGDKNAAEITRNQGRIQALKIEQHTQALKFQQQADAEELSSMLRAMDAEIEGTKTGSTQRVEIIREELALVIALYGQQGEEYEKMLGKLAAADREHATEVQKAAEKELAARLKAIKEAADAQAAADAKDIAGQQKVLDARNSMQQSQLKGTLQDAKRLGLPDIGQVEAIYQQMKDTEQRYINGSIMVAQSAAEAKIQALQKVQQAAEIAALENPANSAKFVQDAQAAADKITTIETELQAKLKDLRQKGAEEDQKIEQELVQYKEQEEQKIASKMLQFEDQALFHSKSFGQAVIAIYRDLAQSVINDLLQMANRWVSEHVVMELATRLFHLRTAAESATANVQQQTQTSTSNVTQVTSEAGLAAAKAYAAYAEFPPLAASMAAEAESAVLAFLPEAAAQAGFDVPFGEFPVTQLHPEEMVLPEHLANTVRNLSAIAPQLAQPSFQVPQLPDSALAASRGEFGGSITNITQAGGEPGGDFHYHAGNVNASALDRTGVADVLRRHSSDVAKQAMKMAKAGHFNRAR